MEGMRDSFLPVGEESPQPSSHPLPSPHHSFPHQQASERTTHKNFADVVPVDPVTFCAPTAAAARLFPGQDLGFRAVHRCWKAEMKAGDPSKRPSRPPQGRVCVCIADVPDIAALWQAEPVTARAALLTCNTYVRCPPCLRPPHNYVADPAWPTSPSLPAPAHR